MSTWPNTHRALRVLVFTLATGVAVVLLWRGGESPPSSPAGVSTREDEGLGVIEDIATPSNTRWVVATESETSERTSDAVLEASGEEIFVIDQPDLSLPAAADPALDRDRYRKERAWLLVKQFNELKSAKERNAQAALVEASALSSMSVTTILDLTGQYETEPAGVRFSVPRIAGTRRAMVNGRMYWIRLGEFPEYDLVRDLLETIRASESSAMSSGGLNGGLSSTGASLAWKQQLDTVSESIVDRAREAFALVCDQGDLLNATVQK